MPNLYDYIMHKLIFYQYEKEVRAVASAFFGYKDIEANIVDGPYAPKIVPQKLINEVVVHPRASSEFFAKVTKFCAIHNLPKPILSGLSQEPIA